MSTSRPTALTDQQMERSVRALQRAARRPALHHDAPRRAATRQAHRQRLIERVSPAARRYAAAILRDRDLAEDAVQEAWLEAFTRLPALREPRAFGAWFRRVVFKQCDRIRRRHSYNELSEAEPGETATRSRHDDERGHFKELADKAPDPEALWIAREERRELRRRLRGAYRGLSSEERQLARLRFLKERKHSDIARELGVSEDTVKNRLRALRRRLRHDLDYIPQAKTRAAPTALGYQIDRARHHAAPRRTPRWLCRAA